MKNFWKEKVLVIVDMQNDFITGSLGSKDAEAIVPLVKEFAEKYDGDILFTKDTHFKEAYHNTQEGRKLPIEHCIRDTKGWCIVNDLAIVEQKAKLIINKYTFGWYEIGERLEGVKEVDICGLCTDICVIANAMIIKSFDPETIVRVHKDLCAGTSKDNHENALKAMAQCQIEIV